LNAEFHRRLPEEDALERHDPALERLMPRTGWVALHSEEVLLVGGPELRQFRLDRRALLERLFRVFEGLLLGSLLQPARHTSTLVW